MDSSMVNSDHRSMVNSDHRIQPKLIPRPMVMSGFPCMCPKMGSFGGVGGSLLTSTTMILGDNNFIYKDG